MNKVTKIVFGLVVVGVVLWLGVTYPTGNSVVSQIVGSSVGPESSSDFSCNVGVCTHYRKQAFRLATTTICVLPTPSATTTLLRTGGTLVRTKASGATVLDIGIAPTAFATSSTYGISTFTVATGPSLVDFATSSPSLLVPANRYLVMKLATSSLSANWDGVGNCTAVFGQIN